MKQSATPISQDIVFIGGGHAHAVALRMLAMHALPGVRLTLISNTVQTPYSGMLPGLIAGHYRYDEAHIDLGRLCRACGVRFIEDTVVGLDPESKQITCKAHPPFGYDLLSIDIGSTPDRHSVPGAEALTHGVKPVPKFLAYWRKLQRKLMEWPDDSILKIGTVGGGASAVEVLLAMQYQLQQMAKQESRSLSHVEFHLLASADQVLPGHNQKVREQYSKLLTTREIRTHHSFRVSHIKTSEQSEAPQTKQVFAADGRMVELDEIIWATSATAASWPAKAGLSCNSSGFITVNDTLQTLSHPSIFATGDIAEMVNHPRPKAGVFAVRQGKPLAINLLRALQGKPLKPFKPQQQFLSLVSTGDRYAVASRGNWALSGKWVWRWKDHIDRTFMDRFSTFKMPARPATQRVTLPLTNRQDDPPMRCGGCGAKVGQPILQRVISQLTTPLNTLVHLGLDAPDDAAVLQVPADKYLVQSVDAFRSMIDDDFLFGQVAANHALGDVFAMGATPHSAQAIVTLPFANEAKVEQQLFHVMQGATAIFNQCGMTLVGGHTAEGAELSVGFVVNGLASPDKLLRKSGLQAGDKIILTKPLGTGALFAADMRGEAQGQWIKSALRSMVQLNQSAADCLIKYGAKACTDVTGFGLAGHLLEMLRASNASATLLMNEIPQLEGAAECFRAGIVSTLQPQNEKAHHAISNWDDFADLPERPILFDPQTAGGLIAGVPSEQADACINALVAHGYIHAAIIGQVSDEQPGIKQITLN